jgi:hypothetical protein
MSTNHRYALVPPSVRSLYKGDRPEPDSQNRLTHPTHESSGFSRAGMADGRHSGAAANHQFKSAVHHRGGSR